MTTSFITFGFGLEKEHFKKKLDLEILGAAVLTVFLRMSVLWGFPVNTAETKGARRSYDLCVFSLKVSITKLLMISICIFHNHSQYSNK